MKVIEDLRAAARRTHWRARTTASTFDPRRSTLVAAPPRCVTVNLYLPKKLERPAPTILYACGHLRQMTNGVSLGNKAGYQADGAWYARNGYVCLVLDSLQLGEIQGIHTGTRNLGAWWWNSRGYTPAGVEAWFGIRALDYLCTRPEVDTNRFGITGHSGGGAYSILTGIAANHSFVTGKAVEIAGLVPNIPLPDYPPMPTHDQPVPMPPRA